MITYKYFTLKEYMTNQISVQSKNNKNNNNSNNNNNKNNKNNEKTNFLNINKDKQKQSLKNVNYNTPIDQIYDIHDTTVIKTKDFKDGEVGYRGNMFQEKLKKEIYTHHLRK